jgi:ABC-type multidrug transport system fused ATPase/permease subunit
VETGSHTELLARGGTYAHFCHAQFSGQAHVAAA